MVAASIFIFIKNKRSGNNQNLSGNSSLMPETEFMTSEEKANFSLPADSKIQVLQRDASGGTSVYRVIRRDEDIVADPSRIGEPGMVQDASQQK